MYIRPYPNHYLEEYRKAKVGIPDPPQEVIDMPPYVHQEYPKTLYLEKADAATTSGWQEMSVPDAAAHESIRADGWQDTYATFTKKVAKKG